MAILLSKAEKSYVQSSLLSTPPLRSDGRSLHDYRPIHLETGVVPLANGSARVSVGGGTEVLAAVKLEVDDIEEEGEEGKMICSVSCSPAAYPHLQSSTLDDLSHDLTTTLHQTISHHSLHPSNLSILKKRKAWTCYLDMVVLNDSGNIYDALFISARAALWDTKVPRTRSVGYIAKSKDHGRGEGGGGGDMDRDDDVKSGLDTRRMHMDSAMDFELPDYWDEGEVLAGREAWPVCVTLNLIPPLYYLDATSSEESSTPFKLLLIFSFRGPSGSPLLQAMRVLGPGEVKLHRIKELVKDGEKHALNLLTALNMKLKEEDSRRGRKARERFMRAGGR